LTTIYYCASAGNTPELEPGKVLFHHKTVELLKKHQHIPAEDGNPVARENVKLIMSNPVTILLLKNFDLKHYYYIFLWNPCIQT